MPYENKPELGILFCIVTPAGSGKITGMLKGLFLLFEPFACWEDVYHARPKWARVLFIDVLPVLVLSLLAECFHLVKFGKWQDIIGHQRFFTRNEVVVLGAAQLILWMLFIVLAARLVQALTQTFHTRGSYEQALCVVGYSLLPLFILQFFNALPFISFWITFSIGILFTIRAMYHGLPRIMDPDPIHTFGLFLTSSMFVAIGGGILRFVGWWYYRGHIHNLDSAITSLTSKLPF